MKIIHTSDWHLGHSLYGRKRYEEFSLFLEWLGKIIENERIDALLVAGDVFDTSTPGNRAQELYYRFLCRVSASCCRHIIVIAGNHDSPSFLEAPKEILRVLNVHVIGTKTDNPDDEVIVLRKDDCPEAIICAVPYLRDKDIRTVEPGETIDDKNRKLVEGLKKHYSDVCAIAEQKRSDFEQTGITGIPIIAMGHLFTAGGKTTDGDGVRELYVGSLVHIEKDVFPPSIDYLALGHLHISQSVNNAEHIRYSGSPLPMGYGEANQKKKVITIEFIDSHPNIQEIQVPTFQQLIRITGSKDEILFKIQQLKNEQSRAWLEIEYTGPEIISNLRETIDDAIDGSFMEIRRIKNKRFIDHLLTAVQDNETLDDLETGDVFSRCMDSYNVPDEDRDELIAAYNEILNSLLEEDKNAD